MTDEDRSRWWVGFCSRVQAKQASVSDKGHIYMLPADISVAVEFTAQEKTKARYRHPRFLQLRPDKPLLDCIF